MPTWLDSWSLTRLLWLGCPGPSFVYNEGSREFLLKFGLCRLCWIQVQSKSFEYRHCRVRFTHLEILERKKKEKEKKKKKEKKRKLVEVFPRFQPALRLWVYWSTVPKINRCRKLVRKMAAGIIYINIYVPVDWSHKKVAAEKTCWLSGAGLAAIRSRFQYRWNILRLDPRNLECQHSWWVSFWFVFSCNRTTLRLG